MRKTGVTAIGIVAPVFKQGDDLVAGVCKAVAGASESEGFRIEDKDIIAVTESVVARTQGNFASCAQIAADVRQKFGGGTLGAVFPIFSRNRFSILLKAIAMGCERLVLQLPYPSDEVGNHLVSSDTINRLKVNPMYDSFDETGFRAAFGAETKHLFTGVDYIEYYKKLGNNIELVFSNDPAYVLKYTKSVLCCDIHSRSRTKRALKEAGADIVYGLDDLLTQSVDGSGFNPDYGLLGSNMSSADSVKLFPRDCAAVVENISKKIFELTGRRVEAMIYGDGCFKDPIGGIWELADPVVSPAYTPGLAGTPNELKMKYIADNQLDGLEGEALDDAMRRRIREKDSNLTGLIVSQGTTPRRYVDLLGSLCDLVSGSGDRGTPVVYVKGYFTNYATE